MIGCIDLSNITTGLSAMLTPLIAIITVTILVLQYFLARRRWRLDLYDKRYPVFTGAMDYISFVLKHGTMTFERLSQYQRDSKDKEFLFGADVHDFLDRLYKQGVELWTAQEVINSPQGVDDEYRQKLILERANVKIWFGEQFEVAKALFEPYLKIAHK